jgi:hypothetical protein
MRTKFHVGKARYQSLVNSRYNHYTYGEIKFSESETDTEATAHGTYGVLLFDKRWIAKRTEILIRDNNQCIICFSAESLQVHHRQYHFIKALKQFKAPWDYEPSLMITLCEKCHARGHSKFRVPKVYM